jgi:hypothetical protein
MKYGKQATTTAVANSKGNKNGAFGRSRAFGATRELGEHTYVLNKKVQAEQYIRTTEKIAQYAGLHIGKEMRYVVMYHKEYTITEPPYPEKEEIKASPGRMEKYKVELSAYQKRMDKYDDDKAQLYIVILGQCTEKVKLKLKADPKFEDLEKDYDVVGFLKLLRIIMFSTTGVQHECMAAHEAYRRFTNIVQGPKESLEHFIIRFNALAEVSDEIHGLVVPTKIMTQETDRDKASEKYRVMIFLCGLDKIRYGKLLDELHNAYLAKTDKYPSTMDDAVTLFSNYCDGQAPSKQKKTDDDEDDGKQFERSFAQITKNKGKNLKKKGVKIVCYTCGQPGHASPKCPLKDQQSDDESIKSSSSKGSKGDRSQLLHWSGME